MKMIVVSHFVLLQIRGIFVLACMVKKSPVEMIEKSTSHDLRHS